MPEGLEAEIWRRSLAPMIGRTISTLEVDHRVTDDGLVDTITGARIIEVERTGKVVVVHTDRGNVGLHFGMTGRLVVDGVAPIERLEYASGDDRPEWDRLRMWTAPAATSVPAIRMNDPRRLGRISLDPDLSRLGVDVLPRHGGLGVRALRAALVGRRGPVKSVLLDQGVVAGLGNLCADEVLWWASIAPHRPVPTLADDEVTALASAIRRRLPVMLARGGSTTGTLDPDRRRGGRCPRDGVELERVRLGGRTAVWCPGHQR